MHLGMKTKNPNQIGTMTKSLNPSVKRERTKPNKHGKTSKIETHGQIAHRKVNTEMKKLTEPKI